MTRVAQFYLLLLLLPGIAQLSLARSTPDSSKDALYWLTKVAEAPRQHNYQGTFVYYADGIIETSRIVHVTDAKGEREKIEVLDGVARVVIRNEEEMKCYFPDSKTVVTERRWFRKFFPDILPQPFEDVNASYVAKKGKKERIAGRYSQVIFLEPRDNLRYGHRIWVDINTGLALKMAIVDDNRKLEQFSFAELKIGDDVGTQLLNSSYSEMATEWKNHNLMTSVLSKRELEWQLRELPAGFRIIIEMKRNLAGKSVRVDHIALTDGIATVSIFIRPMLDGKSPHVSGFLSTRGATNIYVRAIDDHMVTTVGEVPLETVQLIGDAVFKRIEDGE